MLVIFKYKYNYVFKLNIEKQITLMPLYRHIYTLAHTYTHDERRTDINSDISV